MGGVVGTTARGVGSLIGGVFRAVVSLAKYYATVVEHPVTWFISLIAPKLAQSSRPAPLTKYATLDESQNRIENEKKRLETENPGLASEYEKIKEDAFSAGDSYSC